MKPFGSSGRVVLTHGGVTFQALELHTCRGSVESEIVSRVTLVRRNPDVWALQLIAAEGRSNTPGVPGTASFVELIRYCPFCGANLSPPPLFVRLEICVCGHTDMQHECIDPLANELRGCNERVLSKCDFDCEQFEARK